MKRPLSTAALCRARLGWLVAASVGLSSMASASSPFANARQLADASVPHAEEDAAASENGRPCDAIGTRMLVITFIRKAIRGFAGYGGHDDCLWNK